MKKNAFVIVMGLIMALPISAQSWNSWDTHRTINGVFGIANAAIESAERKKEMEIHARQKVEFEQSFKDAMKEAKDFEEKENWEEALEKYEEAANLNCKYGYTDQRTLSKKITSLYVKGGREDDGLIRSCALSSSSQPCLIMLRSLTSSSLLAYGSSRTSNVNNTK